MNIVIAEAFAEFLGWKFLREVDGDLCYFKTNAEGAVYIPKSAVQKLVYALGLVKPRMTTDEFIDKFNALELTTYVKLGSMMVRRDCLESSHPQSFQSRWETRYGCTMLAAIGPEYRDIVFGGEE